VRGALSIRDLLGWVTVINATAPKLGALVAYAHGAHLTLLDGLGLGSGLPPSALVELKRQCARLLATQLPADARGAAAAAAGHAPALTSGVDEEAPPPGWWGIAPFFIPLGPSGAAASGGQRFELRAAPTAARNAFRLLRAMQLRRAVLLEGSPGVGKTTLVAALARQARVPLVRVNLSEHTDMMDLLGADLPAPGGAAGQFAWCDGPLLGALKSGAWVLLDELNLANQVGLLRWL
jgi:midasin